MGESQSVGKPVRRVLSIDGGGIRGIIPAMVIAHIEKKMGRSAHELFDLMVGTSTGGILALGLAHPGLDRPAQYSARRVVRLYEEHGGKIFEDSLWRKVRSVGGLLEEAYSHEVLEAILGQYFAEAMMAECDVPTMVTSYDIQNRRTVFLKSWHEDHGKVLCCDAARATSAAPTYFEPKPLDTGDAASVLIDGGIFMNSPSVSAYAEARKLFPEDPIAVLSLGTGELTRPIPYDEARTWGSAVWVMSLLDCMFDGVSKAADHQMRLFLGERYYRLQTSLDTASDDMDDASKENIGNLKNIARELIQKNETALERFFAMEATE